MFSFRRRFKTRSPGNSTRFTQSKTPLLIELLEGRTLMSASTPGRSWLSPHGVSAQPRYITQRQLGTRRIRFVTHTVSTTSCSITARWSATAADKRSRLSAHSNPNVEKDLQVFSDTFDLPDANFKRVSQTRNGKLPSTDPGWALETALDVQSVQKLRRKPTSCSLRPIQQVLTICSRRLIMPDGSPAFRSYP